MLVVVSSRTDPDDDVVNDVVVVLLGAGRFSEVERRDRTVRAMARVTPVRNNEAAREEEEEVE